MYRTLSVSVLLAVLSSCGKSTVFSKREKTEPENSDRALALTDEFDQMSESILIGNSCKVLSDSGVNLVADADNLKSYRIEKTSQDGVVVLDRFAISTKTGIGLLSDTRTRAGYWKFAWSKQSPDSDDSLIAKQLVWEVDEASKITTEFSVIKSSGAETKLDNCL